MGVRGVRKDGGFRRFPELGGVPSGRRVRPGIRSGRAMAPGAVCLVLLSAAGCVVGPTIEDEKPKAPAAAEVPGGAGGMGGERIPGANPLGQVPGDTAAPPPAGDQGSSEHTFRNGLRARVLPPTVTRSAPGGGADGDLVEVALPVTYFNGTRGGPMPTILLDAELYSGPQEIRCARAPGEERPMEEIARGTERTVTYTFLVPRAHLGRLLVQVKPVGVLEKFQTRTFAETTPAATGVPGAGPTGQPDTVVVPRPTPSGSASGRG